MRDNFNCWSCILRFDQFKEPVVNRVLSNATALVFLSSRNIVWNLTRMYKALSHSITLHTVLTHPLQRVQGRFHRKLLPCDEKCLLPAGVGRTTSRKGRKTKRLVNYIRTQICRAYVLSHLRMHTAHKHNCSF